MQVPSKGFEMTKGERTKLCSLKDIQIIHRKHFEDVREQFASNGISSISCSNLLMTQEFHHSRTNNNGVFGVCKGKHTSAITILVK